MSTGRRQVVNEDDVFLAFAEAMARKLTASAVRVTGSGTPGGELPSGSGGGEIDVEEGDVAVAAANTLNFNGTDFNVTDDGSGQVTVALAGGGATALVVKEGDVDVDITVSALDFDDSSFTLTESPEDEINIDLNYGTGAGQPAEGNHTHTSAGITDFTEAVQDVVGTQIVAGDGIGVVYDDAGAGSVTITATGGGAELALTWSINEGGVPSLGEKNPILVPFAATIKRWYILADGVGDLTLDVWKDTYGNWPIGNGSTIVAAAKPTLAGASKGTDSTLTGWTTSISLDDILMIEVEAAESIGFFTFSLIVERT